MKKIREQDGFEIYFEALPENLSIEQVLGLEETGIDHSETIQKVKDGEFSYFSAHVIAIKNKEELGDVYLSACIEEKEEDFYNRKDCYFDQMVDEAIEKAQKNIKDITTKISGQTYHSIKSAVDDIDKLEYLLKNNGIDISELEKK